MTLRLVAALLVAVLVMVGTAAAQGRGRGPGKTVGAPVKNGSASAAPVVLQPSPSFPQFGTWLDDATTAAVGAGYLSIGTSYWRAANADQVDAPILGLTYGIAQRAQLSATVPFYRATYEGFSSSGLDTIYISGKIAVVDPDAGSGRFGLAIGAAAEILSAGFADVSRAHWVVPLSMELRGSAVRVYGSTGYFSRGAFFSAGAFEWTMPTGTSVTASLARSASVRGVTTATIASSPRSSLHDASVFLSHPVSSTASVFVGGSRTFSATWIDGASSVSGGLSFRFASPRTRMVPGDEKARCRAPQSCSVSACAKF
jgi:hypothetical protein